MLIDRVKSLDLFDKEWYITNNADVDANTVDPWDHFCSVGLIEGRQPGPKFDPDLYAKLNPDVKKAGINPLIHYLEHGFFEGRHISHDNTWPESPIPENLPQWYGGLPNPDAEKYVTRILYCLSVKFGGTSLSNQNLMRTVQDIHGDNVECFVLFASDHELTFYLFKDDVYLPIQKHKIHHAILVNSHISQDFDNIVNTLLDDYKISIIHIQHSWRQSFGVVECAIKKNIPIVYSFHDYYSVCPSIKLLDSQGHYCAGRCTINHDDCRVELTLDGISNLKHQFIYRWQINFSQMISLCSALITTDINLKRVINEIYPSTLKMPFHIIPHGRDFDYKLDVADFQRNSDVVKILVPGNIGIAKGAEVLISLASNESLANVEWHVLGTIQDGLHMNLPKNIIVHGKYDVKDFKKISESIKPTFGAILSVWPESWCHTLTELWSVGLPVFGFNIGAVGERVVKSGAGWLANEYTTSSMLQLIKSVINDDSKIKAGYSNVKKWQVNGQFSDYQMASSYWNVYKSLLS